MSAKPSNDVQLDDELPSDPDPELGTIDDADLQLADDAIGAPRASMAERALTDSGNAERLVDAYGTELRYCASWAKWLAWDGVRWATDEKGRVSALTKTIARRLYASAAACTDKETRSAIATWARKSESKAAREAMIALARFEPGIAVVASDLDRDPWLLNTPTCTVDLRTGVAREHRREDLITKCTAASYDGAAKSALWERVVSEAMGGDAELVAFFQRAAGYSCAGDTREEKLFMPIGPAASGKSTVIEAIRAALGDYACTADFEAFVQQKHGGGPRNDIARLAGARFVASIEVERGKRLAQGLVKSLTGGDTVSARFLYSEAFEFRPAMKLWLVANDAPRVSDDDGGMWRRIARIPFEHVVPSDRRDPAVKAELLDADKGGAAILAWLVEGCLRWRAHGLGEPSAVRAATDRYRDEQDPLRTFLADCCAVLPGVSCKRSDLRAAYEAWTREAGDRTPITGHEFTERIRRIEGVSEKTLKGVRRWSGIGLHAQSESPFDAEGDS